ncbi:MAG TPA: hypothetical protein H9996_05710 [Candidatus Faecalibacterium avium]|nr:hypothetical protein [Candidatus Faecalibacterium avium]
MDLLSFLVGAAHVAQSIAEDAGRNAQRRREVVDKYKGRYGNRTIHELLNLSNSSDLSGIERYACKQIILDRVQEYQDFSDDELRMKCLYAGNEDERWICKYLLKKRGNGN